MAKISPDELVELERLRAAMQRVSDIRDSIVGCQGFNFSEHAYPLVTVLNEAGFKGAGYDIARKNLGTLIERCNKAEDEVDRLATRQHELLATIVRLTNEVPFASEFVNWTATRAAMIAEIGTLRSQVAELEQLRRTHAILEHEHAKLIRRMAGG